MKVTVKQLMGMLCTLPPNMPVQFSVISSAFLGTEGPLRVKDIEFYDSESRDTALPTDKGAYACLYLYEDRIKLDQAEELKSPEWVRIGCSFVKDGMEDAIWIGECFWDGRDITNQFPAIPPAAILSLKDMFKNHGPTIFDAGGNGYYSYIDSSNTKFQFDLENQR